VAFLRIDIPHPQVLEMVAASQFYAPQGVYAITPTTEEIARAIALGAPEPVSRWDLRARAETTPGSAEIVDIGSPEDGEGDEPLF
jgi:hypothetical protein